MPPPDPPASPANTPASGHRRGRAVRPQLTVDELQQVRWLLGGVLTLLSVATVFYLDVEAAILMACTGLVVLAALVRPEWPGRIPRWGHRLAFPLIVAFFMGDLWIFGELLPAMVRLDILLLLYRGITYRQKRDDLQVIVLGLFLVVVAGVLSVSLWFAAQILVFTAGALAFLLVITLTESLPATVDVASATPAWAQRVSWRRLLGRVRTVMDWRVVTLGAALFAGVVGVSVVLFLALPRFQLENSFFLERFITKKSRTGFSDTVRFGDVTEIQQDTSVALSVDVSDRGAIPAAPYWRMMVLDDYREGTFRLSPATRRLAFSNERSGLTVAGRKPAGDGTPVYWTFYLESGVSRFLPLLGDFETLRFRETQNHRTAPDLGIVALRDEPVTMTAYRVEGLTSGAELPDETFAARWRERGENVRAGGALMVRLGVGATDVAVLERIGREILAGETLRGDGRSGGVSVEEFARQANAWLAARHVYSLQPRLPVGAGDPLVRWLDSSEGGHCELFAGSLVLLARAVGIPARVVTGFHGGSWNGYSNNFTLRNSDAHAWCELFDASRGVWVRADPTPGSAGAPGETPGEAALARRLDRSWTARLDSLRVFWYRRIVSFDQSSQLETLKAVKTATQDSGKRLRAWVAGLVRELRAWAAQPWSGARIISRLAFLAGGAALVGALAVAARALWRRRGGRVNAGDAVRREAGRWLALLAARGPRGEDATSAGVRADLQRLRFGARENWPEPRTVFRRARELRRRRPSEPPQASTPG